MKKLGLLYLNKHIYSKHILVFAIYLTSEIINEENTLSLSKRGTVKLDLRFSKNLDKPCYVIVYAQFENLIQIDKYRNVSTDYQ